MPRYLVTGRRFGEQHGCYSADDKQSALDALARKRGHSDYAEACQADPEEYEGLRAVGLQPTIAETASKLGVPEEKVRSLFEEPPDPLKLLADRWNVQADGYE